MGMTFFQRAFLLSVLGLISSCTAHQNNKNVISTKEYNAKFEMPDILLPDIPDYSVNLLDFGGISDGINLNSKAFADAIEDLKSHGGGKLIIPQGIWYTGPITLIDNINIHAEAGALILFSTNFDDYPLISTSFEGLDTYRCLSPINAKGVNNIAFTGQGVFDGNGQVWRAVNKSKLSEGQWEKLVKSGGVLNDSKTTWYPSEKSYQGSKNSDFNVPRNRITKEDFKEIKDYLRPVMVSLVECDKVLLDGPTFQNSPAWCLHPLMCTNVVLRNVTVKNPWYSQNGDGLDLESCSIALIENCNFDVGDDAICFKSGKNKTGRDRGMPTENVIVNKCIVYHGHGGFVIGSEMSGGVNNVQVSNCTFIGTDIGLRFKSTRGRGGEIKNIHISDINMVNIVNEPIRFNLYYFAEKSVREAELAAKTEEELLAIIPQVTEETPVFRDIFISNINCKDASRVAYLQGLPEKYLENIQIKNVSISAREGMFCANVENIVMKNVRLKVDEGPAFYFRHVKGIKISELTRETNFKKIMVVDGFLNKNIQVQVSDFMDIDKQIEVVNQAKKDVLIVD